MSEPAFLIPAEQQCRMEAALADRTHRGTCICRARAGHSYRHRCAVCGKTWDRNAATSKAARGE